MAGGFHVLEDIPKGRIMFKLHKIKVYLIKF